MHHPFPSDRLKDHGMNVEEALEGCNWNHSVILLAHQPRAAKEALDNHKGLGLVLSGTCDFKHLNFCNVIIIISNYHNHYCNSFSHSICFDASSETTKPCCSFSGISSKITLILSHHNYQYHIIIIIITS